MSSLSPGFPLKTRPKLQRKGRTTAQTVNGRLSSADVRVMSLTSPCGTFSWQSGTGTTFSPSSSVLPGHDIITPQWLSPRGCPISLRGQQSETVSPHPHRNTTTSVFVYLVSAIQANKLFWLFVRKNLIERFKAEKVKFTTYEYCKGSACYRSLGTCDLGKCQ